MSPAARRNMKPVKKLAITVAVVTLVGACVLVALSWFDGACDGDITSVRRIVCR
jgi:hypothetical protein